MTFRFPKLAGIIALLILAILIVLFIIFLNLPSGKTPTQTATPTSSPDNNSFKFTSKIRARAVSPAEDLSGKTILNPSQAITYSFSQSLTPAQVKVEVSPRIPLKIGRGDIPGSITVSPYPPDFWAPNVLYVVVISDLEGKVITSYNIKVPLVKFQEVVD